MPCRKGLIRDPTVLFSILLLLCDCKPSFSEETKTTEGPDLYSVDASSEDVHMKVRMGAQPTQPSMTDNTLQLRIASHERSEVKHFFPNVKIDKKK